MAFSIKTKATWMGRVIAALVLAVCSTPPAWAQASGGPSAREQAQGAWNGNWTLQRDDPRIFTRGGAETLRLQIVQNATGTIKLQWVADRGICEDPTAGPCEWVTARGTGHAVSAGPGSLGVLLRISADTQDPFLLVLERRADGRATARLISEKGGIDYRLDAERE